MFPATVSSKSLLLLQVGTPPEEIRAQVGDLDDWFRAAIGAAAQAMEVAKVFEGARLPAPGVHRAVLITGSWAMVTDRLPWSEAVAQWIRLAMAKCVPMFGVCYGHQLMAHALGGTVGYHPKGREMGCMDITLHPSAVSDPLLTDSPGTFKAQLTHLQTVLKAPASAQVLAHSSHDPHQILRYAPNAISTQFHPEFTPAIASACIRARTQALEDEGFDAASMLDRLAPTPIPVQMLQRFLDRHL